MRFLADNPEARIDVNLKDVSSRIHVPKEHFPGHLNHLMGLDHSVEGNLHVAYLHVHVAHCNA